MDMSPIATRLGLSSSAASKTSPLTPPTWASWATLPAPSPTLDLPGMCVSDVGFTQGEVRKAIIICLEFAATKYCRRAKAEFKVLHRRVNPNPNERKSRGCSPAGQAYAFSQRHPPRVLAACILIDTACILIDSELNCVLGAA